MQRRWNPLHKRVTNRFRPQPLAASQAGLAAWFNGRVGRYLLAKERQVVGQQPMWPGYQLMELGLSPDASLLDQYDNLHRFALSSGPADGAMAVADFEALPLPSDTIDVALIHHALEFSERPHVVLNEAARVVAPGGHLVLFVLNPWSLLGLSKWAGWLLSDNPVWRHHSLRLGRLVDWLRLLHFRSVRVQRGGFGSSPQSTDAGLLDRWGSDLGYSLGLPAGMFYTIVARKHVARAISNRGELWSLNGAGIKVPKLGWQQPLSKNARAEQLVSRNNRESAV